MSWAASPEELMLAAATRLAAFRLLGHRMQGQHETTALCNPAEMLSPWYNRAQILLALWLRQLGVMMQGWCRAAGSPPLCQRSSACQDLGRATGPHLSPEAAPSQASQVSTAAQPPGGGRQWWHPAAAPGALRDLHGCRARQEQAPWVR